MTNFNLVPNRRDPKVVNKWTFYPKDILPMWVADMDFPAPRPILNELHKVLEQGVLGYELPSVHLQETVAARMDSLHSWKVKAQDVVAVPGVISGITVAARAFGSSKTGILIQTPVFDGFHEVKNSVNTPQVNAPFAKSVQGNILHYEIDWDVFEKQVKKAGIFLLCNPHNPLGIIFNRKELTRMAEICLKNKVLIVSDEIHCELLLDDNRFTPMAKISSEVARNTITLIAPSKTFNVPGLFCAFAIIQNKELRERYVKEVMRLRLHVGSPGLHASRVAFSGQCDGWLRDLRRYLTGNRDFVVDYVTRHMPGVRTTIPDATYLSWLDFTQTGIKGSPFEFFKDKAKVALSDGKIFGREGERHLRLNFGTSRTLLKQGLDRMRKALENRK
jgi:cysteine-S-conjugate beta-lyase